MPFVLPLCIMVFINIFLTYRLLFLAGRFIKNRDKRYYYDPNSKSWIIDINDPDDAENERVWLENNIYKGHFRGEIKKISIFDRYK